MGEGNIFRGGDEEAATEEAGGKGGVGMNSKQT